MQSRYSRHLGLLLGETAPPRAEVKVLAAGITRGGRPVEVPPELTGHQFAVMLLHIAAEIEHSLMVTYLYAAYSLGGEQVPPEHRKAVTQWREIILGIAKEEMGHLMTVQNLLRCVGGPVSVDREDYPWDSEFYPFPFRLQRLDRDALARYVYVESPPPDRWKGDEADSIRERALKDADDEPVNRVGLLYDRLIDLFRDPAALKDSAFRGATFPFQANWDEWGRGYQKGARGAGTGGNKPDTPDLLLRPVTCRTDAVKALEAVKDQGEATPTADESSPSHFARFLAIYRDFPEVDDVWDPARRVPVNPIVTTQLREPEVAKALDRREVKPTPITHPDTQLWAHLFNVRYRLLMTCLLRTFEYPNNTAPATQVSPRGLLLNAVFGEMYNLRALAQALVEMPLDEEGEDKAGPPFQMPYTLRQPVDPEDRWRTHLDLLEVSRRLASKLEGKAPRHDAFLKALRQTDDQVRGSIEAIVGRSAVAVPGGKGSL
jgi:hypothetical protein